MYIGLGDAVEVGVEQRLGQHDGLLLTGIGVVGAHSHVVDFRTHAEGRVRGQRPGCGGPCQEVGRAPARHLGFGVADAELRHDGGILNWQKGRLMNGATKEEIKQWTKK